MNWSGLGDVAASLLRLERLIATADVVGWWTRGGSRRRQVRRRPPCRAGRSRPSARVRLHWCAQGEVTRCEGGEDVLGSAAICSAASSGGEPSQLGEP